jgi:hypothetical protein
MGHGTSTVGKSDKISGRLCEQISAAFREFHEGSALVHHQPAALNRQIQTRLVFVRCAFLTEQKRPVDQLDVDPAVLHDLDGVGDLNDCGRPFRRRSKAGRKRISYAILNRMNGRSGAQKKSANAPKREVSFTPTNGHRKHNAACPKSAMYGRRPRCKWNLTFQRSVRVQPCIRPLNAAAMAAGPDVIR